MIRQLHNQTQVFRFGELIACLAVLSEGARQRNEHDSILNSSARASELTRNEAQDIGCSNHPVRSI